MADQFVTVAAFENRVRAVVVQNFLTDQGIPSVLVDESTVGVDRRLSVVIGGIELQVAVTHAERAQLLLAQVLEQKDGHGPPVSAEKQNGNETQAEREDRSPINQLVDRLFKATVIGWIFCPVQAYAFCLLLEFAGTQAKISPNRRWKVWASVLMSLPVMVAAFGLLYFLYRIVGADA